MLKRLHRRALRHSGVTGKFGPEQEVSETCRGGSTMAHLYSSRGRFIRPNTYPVVRYEETAYAET